MSNPREASGTLKMFHIKYLYKHLTHRDPKREIEIISSEISRYLYMIQRNHKGLPVSHLTKHLPKAVIDTVNSFPITFEEMPISIYTAHL